MLEVRGDEIDKLRAEQAGLAFEWSLPQAPVIVLSEEAQLQVALANLLDNGLRFTPEGGRICPGVPLMSGKKYRQILDKSAVMCYTQNVNQVGSTLVPSCGGASHSERRALQ